MVGKECPAEEINCLTGAGWRQVDAYSTRNHTTNSNK